MTLELSQQWNEDITYRATFNNIIHDAFNYYICSNFII